MDWEHDPAVYGSSGPVVPYTPGPSVVLSTVGAPHRLAAAAAEFERQQSWRRGGGLEGDAMDDGDTGGDPLARCAPNGLSLRQQLGGDALAPLRRQLPVPPASTAMVPYDLWNFPFPTASAYPVPARPLVAAPRCGRLLAQRRRRSDDGAQNLPEKRQRHADDESSMEYYDENSNDAPWSADGGGEGEASRPDQRQWGTTYPWLNALSNA